MIYAITDIGRLEDNFVQSTLDISLKIYLSYVYECLDCATLCGPLCISGVCRGRKRALDSSGITIMNICEQARECWELIPGSLEEQVLLTAEPSF